MTKAATTAALSGVGADLPGLYLRWGPQRRLGHRRIPAQHCERQGPRGRRAGRL